MKATPVIPGQKYRVTGSGIDITVPASNPVDAVLAGVAIALAGRSA